MMNEKPGLADYMLDGKQTVEQESEVFCKVEYPMNIFILSEDNLFLVFLR